MTSRTKRQSSAECALPSELGCPSIFSILRLTIQLTRSRPAKLVLTSVKKWARNCSAWGSFAQSTLSSGGPHQIRTPTATRSGAATHQAREETAPGLGDISDAAPIGLGPAHPARFNPTRRASKKRQARA